MKLSIAVICMIVLLPVSFASQMNLVYDGNGNLVTGDGFYREYNALNQLSAVYNGSSPSLLLQEFTWHPVEERILVKRMFEDGKLVQTVTYVSDNYASIKNSSGTFNEVYVYQDSVLVGKQDAAGDTFAMHPDHLGSTSVVTDSSGVAVDDNLHSPFGEPLTHAQARYSYTGKEYDDLTQDYDFDARRYKAAWGIFATPDTLIQSRYDPQLLNRFAYARNNPLVYVDPDGHAIVHFSGQGDNHADQKAMIATYETDQSAKVFDHHNTQGAHSFVASQLDQDSNQPVIIIGHSRGADAAVRLAKDLYSQGIESDLVVTIDQIGLFDNRKPEGTKVLVNIRQDDGFELRGRTIVGADLDIVVEGATHTNIDNINSNPALGSIATAADDLYSSYKQTGRLKTKAERIKKHKGLVARAKEKYERLFKQSKENKKTIHRKVKSR